MNLLSFVNTNIGIVALRRHENAELMFYTQVWLRTGNDTWKQYHYLSKENSQEFNSGILELLYQHVEQTCSCLPFEDFW